MVQFLQHEFSDFTVFEIWAAVDIAAAPDNPFDLKYNGRVTDFTNDWLTSILRPYRNYRAGLTQRYITEEMIFSGGKPVEKTPEEINAIEIEKQKQLFLHAWQACKNGEPYAGLSRVYQIADTNLLYIYSDADVALAEKQAKDKMLVESGSSTHVKNMHELLVKAIDAGKKYHQLEWQRLLIRKCIKEDTRDIKNVLQLIKEVTIF
jgi:hypothetical protein